MKLLCIEYNAAGIPAVRVIGDDALLRENRDFYLPPFAQEVSCAPQLFVRISRLGKHIAPRFASRYYDAVGAAVRFRADSLASRLVADGLPDSPAVAFEGSAAVSELLPLEGNLAAPYAFALNGETRYSATLADNTPLDTLVALASEYHLLKIGDYLLCGTPFCLPGVKPGDRIALTLREQTLINIRIK